VIRDGLAVAGQTGTLATWKGTSVDGRMRGKTGTLRNATALAGRMEPLQGGTVTFAYVANVPEPGEITSGQVRLTGLADILVGYPRGVDLATLQPEP
jgi:D-alanyl-D-alanine carboxypeptidase